ncbi:MAG: ATP-binding protein [Bacteroidales bacterium]|nr:ATP-binding protein [Bacteroidales bacterium]
MDIIVPKIKKKSNNQMTTKLCYAYIKKYKCLEDIELCFDARYNIKYDKTKNTLIGEKVFRFPENFWGDSVSSVTCLLGNNGAGKSTIVSFILNALVEGSPWNSKGSFSGILVYEKNDDLYAWVSNDITEIEPKFSYPLNITPCNKISIPCFYYSGHFSSYINSDIRTTAELAGFYNASDYAEILLSAENYYNAAKMPMSESLYDALHCYVLQNAHKICRMLADKNVSDKLRKFVFPKYVLIQPNRSGEYQLKSMTPARRKERGLDCSDQELETLKLDENAFFPTREQILADIIHHAILNLIVERYDLNLGIDILVGWKVYLQENYRSTKSVLKNFGNFIIERKSLEYLEYIRIEVDKINTHAEFNDNQGNECLYLDTLDCKFGEKIEKILDKKKIYLVARIFDFSYCQSLEYVSSSMLSSGELEFLNLFSRLYKAFTSENIPQMIFLDEAEIGFHPEWQLKYVEVILDFLNAFREAKNLANPVQIVITTHSPIILSDIPKCCTMCLTKDHTITDEQKETFGNNVFELYRHSFLMTNGLVGKFAQEKIRNFNYDIDSEIEKKEGDCNYSISDEKMLNLQIQVDMIGDVGLKKYLQDKLLCLKSKEQLIAYYEEKIKELKGRNEQN